MFWAMTNKTISELAQDAGVLVAATKDIAGEQVQEARKRANLALDRAKEICGEYCDNAVDGTTAVNEMVHNKAYVAIAIGLGAGVILGYFIARGYKCGCPTRNTEDGA